MATVDTTRYGDLCRLCGTKTGMDSGVHIFENELPLREIVRKIEACLPVQVHQADELPKMVCQNCTYKLDLFFEFRLRSANTQTLLIALYKELNEARVQSEQLNVGMDHPDLVMVHHHLLGAAELDLNPINHRDIIDQQIILSHNVGINAHSLDSIDLNHHELTSQDLSNHSLQTQDAILVDESNAVHTIQTGRYSDANLELMHQDQLTEYTSEQYALSDIGLHEDPISSRDKIVEYNRELNNSTISNSPKSEIDSENKSFEIDMMKNELIKHEDSNSENRLLIDENEKSDIFALNSDNCDIMMGNVDVDVVAKDLYCNLCGKMFNKDEFQSHYDQHFNKCMVCLAVFSNKDALNAHSKEAHGASPEEIKQNIRARFKRVTANHSKADLDSNSDSDDPNDPESIKNEEDDEDPVDDLADSGGGNKGKKWAPKVCKECGKSYKTNYKLTEHMRKHTGEKPYKCSSCEKAFRSKIGLAQHEAKHTGHYDFSCPTCGKGFQCKSYLMVHQRVHSDVKPYPCTTCGQNFKSKQSLMDHTNRHLGVKPYMCDICGRGFITKGLCRSHQKVHTGLDNRKYSCKVCNKMFVSKSYLQTHMRIHTGEKPFMCEVCGKGFLTRVDLRIHSTMHTGEKSYVCEMCGKAFARRDALRCHRRSHTGERPYSCDQCGQTFTQFSPMAIHKRLHTGERPYSCEVCGRKFVSKSTMMTHSKKHDFAKTRE